MVRLSVSDLAFSYRDRPVLSDIAFCVDAGEVLGLVGPNGCGKTTLIKCVDGILTPCRGRVALEGQDLARMHRREVARLIAYVPQSITNHTSSTVFETVLMGRRPYLNWSVRPEDEEKVQEALSLLDLDDLAFRQVRELSGGERQRVMIARAIAQETKAILLDEPTSSLDVHHQMAVMEVIRSLAEERDLSVVIAVHDLNLAAAFCHRLLVMKQGSIQGNGIPADVLTAATIRDVYGIDAVVKHDLATPYMVPVPSGRRRGKT
ncbi:ABC transporter ATP-binding protein [Methanoculleus sp. FWC-SCC1]|uniref:ABC transporter ATP-binding protein n=1 Tax=Methanoculleus frigidifontis TaxID=2584085 RepID=A0ABT8M834_9EURY|nr:ABC transporter ATP-binding protein [Methanoculleus sp. FWC-SCC1]MDN7024064.1 ABC transporter ATP-binding protein [Methanoculleus sp. FWC-SCC1]